MSLVIFLIGKPGSGKSEVRQLITQTVFNYDHNLKVVSIDELEILYEMKDTFPKEGFEIANEGYLIINDRSFFFSTMSQLKKRLLNAITSDDLIICEFSRARYSNILAELISDTNRSYLIIYIDTLLSICIDRNEKRMSNRDKKYIPREVIESFYKKDDLSNIKKQFKKKIEVIDNSKDKNGRLNNVVSKIVESKIIPYFSDKYLIYKNSISWGELTVVILLLSYLALFIWLGYKLIFDEQILKNGKESIEFTSRIFGIAVSGGGIGSTLYCIRSFYSYYLEGLFNFKRYKWWYLFKPITGAIISVALLALFKSQILILTKTDIENNIESYLLIFAISFLAGFSTEQVIERLRKASKALFGEEGDKGKIKE